MISSENLVSFHGFCLKQPPLGPCLSLIVINAVTLSRVDSEGAPSLIFAETVAHPPFFQRQALCVDSQAPSAFLLKVFEPPLLKIPWSAPDYLFRPPSQLFISHISKHPYNFVRPSQWKLIAILCNSHRYSHPRHVENALTMYVGWVYLSGTGQLSLHIISFINFVRNRTRHQILHLVYRLRGITKTPSIYAFKFKIWGTTGYTCHAGADPGIFTGGGEEAQTLFFKRMVVVPERSQTDRHPVSVKRRGVVAWGQDSHLRGFFSPCGPLDLEILNFVKL